MPGLLQQYFPEHGPYLGVYAQVVSGGTVRSGDPVGHVSQQSAAAWVVQAIARALATAGATAVATAVAVVVAAAATQVLLTHQ